MTYDPVGRVRKAPGSLAAVLRTVLVVLRMVLVALLCIIGAAVLLVGGLGVGGVAQLLARDLLLYPLVPWVLLIGVLGVVSLRMRAAENARRH